MPDLGKYAADVLMAYGITFVLIAGLILRTLMRSRKMKRLLAEAEERRNGQ